MLLIKILLTVVLVLMLLSFMRSQKEVETECRSISDPNNCQQYFHCFTILMRCGEQHRFDETTGLCEHRDLVDCGSRPQPIEDRRRAKSRAR